MDNYTSPLDVILSRLDNVKRLGPDRYMASCPVHDDPTPSLLVTLDKKSGTTAWPHCFGGCKQSEVLAALGLTRKDLGMDPDREYLISHLEKEKIRAQLIIDLAEAEEALTEAQEEEAQEAEKTIITNTIQSLALLDPIEYDRQRKAAAKELGVRAAVLDKAVQSSKADTDESIVEQLEAHAEPVDGHELALAISNTLSQYISVQPGALTAITLWILGTYIFNRFRIWPKLTITSPEMRCGKSTLLNDLIGCLAHKALTTSNVQAAGIFRTIELYQPTLLIDEADSFLAKDDAVRGIINAGHNRRGAFVIRCEGDANIPKKFSVWAPMAIAMIDVPAPTILDRSIHIQMRRKTRDEKIRPIPDNLYETLKPLRAKALRWSEEAVFHVDPDLPRSDNDRLIDNWKPLLRIAAALEHSWPERTFTAFRLLTEGQDEPAIGPMLLADIRDAFESTKKHIFRSQDLVEYLTDLEDRPWQEWRKGRPMLASSLAKLLKPYGVRPEPINSKDDQGMWRNRSSYKKEWFQDAFNRYLKKKVSANSIDEVEL